MELGYVNQILLLEVALVEEVVVVVPMSVQQEQQNVLLVTPRFVKNKVPVAQDGLLRLVNMVVKMELVNRLRLQLPPEHQPQKVVVV